MLSALILELRDLHPADWSLASLRVEAERRGWPFDLGADEQWRAHSLEIAGVSGTVSETDDERARGAGVEVTALSFTLTEGDVAEAIELLGPPASIVDGPALRWYAPTARLELAHRRRSLRVSVGPMPWSEDEENRSFEWGEFDSAPYRWRLDRDELLPNGLYLSGGIRADDLAAVLDGVADLFEDLQRSAVALPALVGSPTWIIMRKDAPSQFVQGYFRTTGSVTERWADGSCLENLEHPPTDAGASAAAAAVRHAMSGWGCTSPDELEFEAFSADSAYRLRVLALGLPEHTS